MKKLLKVTTIIIATVFSAIFYFSCSKDAAVNSNELENASSTRIIGNLNASDRDGGETCFFECLEKDVVESECCKYEVCTGCYVGNRGETYFALHAEPIGDCRDVEFIVESPRGELYGSWIHDPNPTINTTLIFPTRTHPVYHLYVMCNGEKVFLGEYKSPCRAVDQM